MNSGSAGSARMECIPVEENSHYVITAREELGKDEMLRALHGAMLPWRATETSP